MLLLLWLSLAGTTAYFAKQRNRNPVLWFFIGLLLGILSLPLILLLPAKAVPVAEKQGEVAPVSLSEAHSEAALPADNSRNFPPIKRIPTSLTNQWYYVDDNQNIIGPFIISELRREIVTKKLDTSIYVWCEEFDDWMQLQEFQNSNILTDPDLVE